MMLVKILAFGSSWWARSGRDPHDRFRYTRHAGAVLELLEEQMPD